jgi:hypothetical protein
MLTKQLAKVYIRKPNRLRLKDIDRLRKKLCAVEYFALNKNSWDYSGFNKADMYLNKVNLYLYRLFKRFTEDALRALKESKFRVLP